MILETTFIKKKKDVHYPEGTMLVDVRYNKNPECFEVIYLDPITNKVEVEYEEAIITIWFLKEEFRTNKYQIPQAEKSKMYPVHCKPSQIAAQIAKHCPTWQQTYDECKQYMKSHELKSKMCECPWVFGAQFLPDVYYRLEWIQKYGDAGSNPQATTFALLDIETDVLDRMIDLRKIDEAPQPINAISIIIPHAKIAAMLVLGPRPRSKLHDKFWHLLDKQEKEFNWLINHTEEFKRRIVDEDEDNKKWLEGYDIRVHTFDFDDEINLIKTAFDYINKYRPMFTLSWNAKFDDNYLMSRIEYLGYDPKEIIIPREFHTTTLYYSEDHGENSTIKTSKDWMFCSSYTTYICQMKLFAAIRKSQPERRSYSLSSVGKDTAKIDKLTNTKSGSFRTFAYTDFLLFLLYNMRDVVVQLAIEMINHDCPALVSRSYMFCTQYSKCFQETHIVWNTKEFFYEEAGYIQACRLLIDPGIDPAYKGAYVAETSNNAPTGYTINRMKVSNIMFGVLDADAKAYYPSSKMGLNEDPATLLYKNIIDNDLFRTGMLTNRSLNQEYNWYDTKKRKHEEDLAAPLINSYKNHNENSVMYNWLGSPSITECIDYLDSVMAVG